MAEWPIDEPIDLRYLQFPFQTWTDSKNSADLEIAQFGPVRLGPN